MIYQLEKQDNVTYSSQLIKCKESLEDGLYVIIITNTNGEFLLSGIEVDSYYNLRYNYPAFLKNYDTIINEQLEEIINHCQTMIHKPVFRIYIENTDSKEIKNTIISIQDQIYKIFTYEIINSDKTKLLNTLFNSNDWNIYLISGDTIKSDFLYNYASTINQITDVELMYCDHIITTCSGAIKPFLKPSWSPDYLESINYIGRGACFRKMKNFNVVYSECYIDFLFRYTEICTNIYHIQKCLLKLVDDPTTGFGADSLQMSSALHARLHRTGRKGNIVSTDSDSVRTFYLNINLKKQPLVSIIIPTAGKVGNINNGKVDFIKSIIQNIVNISTYRNFEIIVVENGDLSDDARKVMTDNHVLVIKYEEIKFNISKKINIGSTIASGDFLIIMNDDMNIITPDWIERMLSHFEKPHIGVVGAKLLYNDMTIQHVGVVINEGNCDHVNRGKSNTDPGYFHSNICVRNYSAVTGACMMVKTSVYKKLGGFSEELAVSYNDIDFCFKIRSINLFIICDPTVNIIHYESQSRVVKLDMEELNLFNKKWPIFLSMDSFYNERILDTAPSTFSISITNRLI